MARWQGTADGRQDGRWKKEGKNEREKREKEKKRSLRQDGANKNIELFIIR